MISRIGVERDDAFLRLAWKLDEKEILVEMFDFPMPFE